MAVARARRTRQSPHGVIGSAEAGKAVAEQHAAHETGSVGLDTGIEAIHARCDCDIELARLQGAGQRLRLRRHDREPLLEPQIDDTERQQRDVLDSSLDWVIAQPVHLTDAIADGMPFTSLCGDVASNEVSRRSVARFLAQAAVTPAFVHQQVALSGAVGARSRDAAG